MVTDFVAVRIKAIQKELQRLHKFLESKGKKPVKLEGLWEGVDITEEDMEEAKRSLFKGAYEFER